MKSNQYLVPMGAESGKRRAVSCLVCEEAECDDKIEFVVGVFEHPPLTAILGIISETGLRRRRMPGERVTFLCLGLSNFTETWRKDSIVEWYTGSRGRIMVWICIQLIRLKAGGEEICHGRVRRCCFSEAGRDRRRRRLRPKQEIPRQRVPWEGSMARLF